MKLLKTAAILAAGAAMAASTALTASAQALRTCSSRVMSALSFWVTWGIVVQQRGPGQRADKQRH